MESENRPRIVAIVPMRHFSRRVSGKNYRPLSGKPLYRYILDTLLSVPEIAEVVVDTDSELIMRDIADDLQRVRVVVRPEHLRSEMLTMNDILLNTVTQVDADYYLQTHSTNPLLKPETITEAISALLSQRQVYDSLFSVTPLQVRLWSADGQALNHDPDHLIRTQDLDPVMEENSCIYIFRRDVLEARRNRIGAHPLVFAMDPAESLDIDTELDWQIVEAMLSHEELDRVNLNDPVASADRWLECFRVAAARTAEELGLRADIDSRLREVGTVGAGGDRTLEIDALAEDAVFAGLRELAGEGASFTAVSEERGVVTYGDGPMRVVIDPIDGSLNAKRGLGHCAMSIAVADGPTTEDLAVAFVWEFGTRDVFHAVRGGGAFLNGAPVAPLRDERLSEDGRLELLCIETSDARRTGELAASLAEIAYRWRILGSIASAMCQVATPRVDAMVNVTRCRVIDAAAAALIVRESGGVVRYGAGDRVLLDLEQRTALCAARTSAVADRLMACVSVD